MSRRACGKVNAGVFFKLGLQAQQEQLRQEHQAHGSIDQGRDTLRLVGLGGEQWQATDQGKENCQQCRVVSKRRQFQVL